MAFANSSDVNGPLAMMVGSFGICVISSSLISTSGCFFNVSPIRLENVSRSTANALPAGTRHSSAVLIIKELQMRISSFSTPTALFNASDRSELEQTSSANPPPECAGVIFFGRISWMVTGMFLVINCHAASHPANPAPMIWTRCITLHPRFWI